MERLLDKARTKSFGLLHILTSSAPLQSRMKILRTVVYGTIRWIVGILFPSKQLQYMINHVECLCVRRMLGIRRGSSELWVDFEQRSKRMARMMIHKHAGLRWGDEFVKAYWAYTGHRVREGVRDKASVAGKLSMFRGLERWRREQKRNEGTRHPRHFPKLMNKARCISDVVGTEQWRVVAANRQQWSSFMPQWLNAMAVPWSSGRQPAIASY